MFRAFSKSVEQILPIFRSFGDDSVHREKIRIIYRVSICQIKRRGKIIFPAI